MAEINKNQKQNQVPQFENLKKLGSLLSQGGINSIKENIIKSKKSLETFCKGIKDRAIEINKEYKDEQEKIAISKIELPKELENNEQNAEKSTFVCKSDYSQRQDGSERFNKQDKPFEKKPFNLSAFSAINAYSIAVTFLLTTFSS